MTLSVTVKLRSKRAELLETAPGFFEARLTKPPEKGRANVELLELLSGFFGVPRSRIVVVSGATARKKLVEISGL